MLTFLLTPPRGGRPAPDPVGDPGGGISTHAPAWGATGGRGSVHAGLPDFYSRPRVGGDERLKDLQRKIDNFYSRPRVGGDAPGGFQRALPQNFYSRPRVGGDLVAVLVQGVCGVFLLTPPRGGRRDRERSKHFADHFYSRPRVGGDWRRSTAFP